MQAYASSKVGTPVTIYVPETTSYAKLKVVKQFGGSVKFHGEDCVEAEVTARNAAKVQQHCCTPYVNEASLSQYQQQKHKIICVWLTTIVWEDG